MDLASLDFVLLNGVLLALKLPGNLLEEGNGLLILQEMSHIFPGVQTTFIFKAAHFASI